MNIAICDDNIYASSQLESIVDSVFAGNSNEYECEVFSSGDSLLRYLDSYPFAFQIYLLDIEMEGTDGLKTAQKIRENDAEAVIIFVTSHAELMPEAFKVLAFQYIIKPYEEDKAKSIIISAVQFLQNRKSLYTFIIRKKVHTLYFSQIEYIESVGRKIVIHGANKELYEYYGTLKEAAEKTAGISFAQVHNSYIINMEKLSMVNAQGLVMQNGEQIPISSKYHDSFHAKWRNFILMRTSSP